MSHTAATAATSINNTAAMPDTISFRRASRTSAAAATITAPAAIVSPERRLWSAILIGLYRDISERGSASQQYIDAVRSEVELEFVASSLGYERGAIRKLLDRAIAEHARHGEMNRANARQSYRKTAAGVAGVTSVVGSTGLVSAAVIR